uniref:PR domain containing 8 n=1 Tax=Monopterus albus TaxID=43700 RepID=A0A3Q3K5T7_MONAL
MDHTFLPRSIWTGDSKFVQHPSDLYSSLIVTRSIPAGTCFGPCVLQNTFYDTVAFIAQKSCDKRAKSYVFRVDPEAMRNSALVVSWLRLVQAARNAEEQNTEAFLKAGQLYVRTTRYIRQEEELLVWYDQELSHLLGFTDMIRGSQLKCGKCNEVFKYQYPFLAHCRFMCSQVKSDSWSREGYRHRHVEIKRQHRVTDFHNIARDLEHKKSGSNEDAEISPKRKKYEETLNPKARKTVLLEKTNISNDDNISQLIKGYDQAVGDSSSYAGKLKADKMKPDHLEYKNDLFYEVGETKGAFTHDGEMDARSETGESSGLHSSINGASSVVLSSSQGEQKSAFCKPSKITSSIGPQAHLSSATIAPSSRLEEMTDAFNSRTVMGYNSLIPSNILSGDLQTLPSPVALNNAYCYAPEHWSRNIGAQMQTTSLTILPPTFTSFGLSVQNWCAKCNLSFRMTSDLVFHMRSHHKKEFAVESQVRRRREVKLTCPICHEYFRERHHLSRHMTSHN